ncbi:helix-turn-helix domain-containing protein [Yinghuangia sp. ASG 101]|uniref:helix-turn-helix domain-containing protein n=1 Tax=Yinghuangia sp. ASG 101 TaxID=2896848 RepID=UPI001E4698D0|nr:helix-turn-helix domain-containing protein [Yinghuangia sp. ASG 101]UGQ12288.1 helix-turn-helix domain-containing protein [Yinghuangia sp. ASG 101]
MIIRRLPPHDWSATSDSGVIGVDGDGFRVRRSGPPAEAGPWFGAVTEFAWDIPRRERRTVTVLPYPAPHLVRIGSRLLLCGVPRTRVVHELTGAGDGFALAIRPGGLARLFGLRDAALLADRPVPLSHRIGPLRTQELADALHEATTPDDHVAALRSRLGHHPHPGTELARSRDVIEAVLNHGTAVRVREAADHQALSIRSLQRLFNVHLGLGPKAATQRCRLVRAAAELVREPHVWTRVVAQFGFFDQPHFINDFGKGLGITPAAFAAQCRTTRYAGPSDAAEPAHRAPAGVP